MQISLAPIQGYTEYPFRNAMNSIIGGVDKYYSPFLRFENDSSIKNKYIKDILPENNNSVNLVPQILTNNTQEFLQFINIVKDFGYKEVNWNLGCPFTPVVKRKLGSGLLAYPETIDKILREVFNKVDINISVKLRSGYLTDTEIFDVITILNKYNLSEIIYHPRIGYESKKKKI